MLTEAPAIIGAVINWAGTEPRIRAIALAGSHARGNAHADSDIDFVLLTTDTRPFRENIVWLHAINWRAIGARPMRWEDEDYGALWSRRVWLEQDVGEIEFGFARPSWADIDPIDIGTKRVVSNGCRIVYDPDKILSRLCTAINQTA